MKKEINEVTRQNEIINHYKRKNGERDKTSNKNYPKQLLKKREIYQQKRQLLDLLRFYDPEEYKKDDDYYLRRMEIVDVKKK